MTQGNRSESDRPGVLNIGVTRYARPLSSTDLKKLTHLAEICDLRVVGFSETLGYSKIREPCVVYLLPLLPVAAFRFSTLVVFSWVLGVWLCAAGRVQVLLSQSPYEGLAGVLVRPVAGLFRRKPLVITEVHGDWLEAPFLYRNLPFASWIRPVLRAWSGFVLRRSDKVRTISRFLEERVRETAPAASRSRFPAYTDFELFRRDRGERPRDGPILAVGALYPVKGFIHLLRAFGMVLSRKPDVKLVIAGDGPLRKTLETAAHELELQDSVCFLGAVNQQELVKLYHEARILILPSLSEGLGRVIWEAMASGLPVVASNVGGVPDLVDDGKTGFLVAPGDEAALSECISWLVEHEEKAIEMGDAGRQAVKSSFSTERYIEGYRALFDGAQSTS